MKALCLVAFQCACASLVANVAAAQDDDSGRWKISVGHSEGEPGNPWVERNRRDPRYVFVSPDIDRSELLTVLLENPLKRVISTDGKGNMTSYSLTDLKWTDEIRDWRQTGCRKYLIEPPIDGYVKSSEFNGALVVEGGVTRLPYGAKRSAHHELRKPDRGRCRVFIYIGASATEGEAFFHEFFRSHVKSGPKITKRHGSLIVESEFWKDGFRSTNWISDDLVVSVFGQIKIDEVVQAYQKKYPSSLPPDLEFDAEAWGRRELSLRLSELRERLELPDESLLYKPPPTFGQAFHLMAQTFDIVALNGEHGREQKRLHEELIAGTEWRQDYEAYKRELVALRRRTLETILKRYEGKRLRFDTKKRKYIPAGEATSLGPEGNVAMVGLLVCAGAGGAVATYVWFRRRRQAAGAA